MNTKYLLPNQSTEDTRATVKLSMLDNNLRRANCNFEIKKNSNKPINSKPLFLKHTTQKKGKSRKPKKQSIYKESPEKYFNVIDTKEEPDLEAELMKLFFNKSSTGIRKKESFIPCSNESIEMVRLGESVHFSNAVISNLSEKQICTDEIYKLNILTCIDLNTSNRGDNDIKIFKSCIDKLYTKTSGLSINTENIQKIHGYLNNIQNIINDTFNDNKKPRVSKTFSDYLNQTK